MVPMNYLSNKKTTSQSISMSPAMKDWLNRYVKRMRSNNPQDEDYSSISAFMCSLLDTLIP